jgi:hypothetical protein
MLAHKSHSRLKTTAIMLLLAVASASSSQARQYSTAREVLAANLEATGGAEAWRGVHTIVRTGTRVLGTPMGERNSSFTDYLRYPGYQRTEESIDSPMGAMDQVIVSTPDARWTTVRDGVRELPVRQWVASDWAKDEFYLLEKDDVELGPLETETGEEGASYVVSFTFNEETYRRKYDQDTLFLTASEAPGNDGKKAWQYFSDYRDVDGFQIPHRWDTSASITINQNGEESTSTITVATTLEDISFNDALTDDLFAR